MLRIGHELLIQVVLNHFFCRCIHLKPAVVFIENTNCPVLLVYLLLRYLRLFNESIWQAQSRIFRSLVWGVDRPNICSYLQADASNLWVFLCWKYIVTQLAYSQAFWWYKFFDISSSTSSCRKSVASFLITYSIRLRKFPKICPDRTQACPGFRQIFVPTGISHLTWLSQVLSHNLELSRTTPPFGQNMFSPWSSHDGDLFLSRWIHVTGMLLTDSK